MPKMLRGDSLLLYYRRFAGDLRAICYTRGFAFSRDRSHTAALYRGTPERPSLVNRHRISQMGVGGRISEVEGATTGLQPHARQRTKRIFPGFLLFLPKPAGSIPHSQSVEVENP